MRRGLEAGGWRPPSGPPDDQTPELGLAGAPEGVGSDQAWPCTELLPSLGTFPIPSHRSAESWVRGTAPGAGSEGRGSGIPTRRLEGSVWSLGTFQGVGRASLERRPPSKRPEGVPETVSLKALPIKPHVLTTRAMA